MFVAQVALCVFFVVALAFYTFLAPPRHPRNVPSVPFWVVLLPFFYDVDQEATYKRYIQKPLVKYGAVKLFFGGQWCLLVQKPSYMAEIFRNEEVFQKSGNQKKIPHSVLAEFLGDNIISSRDETWRLYQSVIKPGLQTTFDIEPLIKNARKLCSLLRDSQSLAGNKGIPMQEILQRYTIANISNTLLQTDFEVSTSSERCDLLLTRAMLKTLENRNAQMNQLQSAVKAEIFRPIFMNFPVLDRFGSLISSRINARRLVHRFSEELEHRLLMTYEGVTCSSASKRLGERLVAAKHSGALNLKQFRDNLNAAFVAGQENPQLLLISTLYLLAKHPEVQNRLREEVKACEVEAPSHEDLQDMSYLTSVIFESLRMFPPISQLINRKVSEPAMLGSEIYIPKGMYIGYNCYSTNRDPNVWGPTADAFRPTRWGSTTEEIFSQYRRSKARAEFISFHGGKRACLGEKLALLEMRVSLYVLVKNFSWRLDATWPDRKTPAGPLYPRALRLVFTNRQKTVGS